MKSANINQAVSGFGMALAAMGASQADAVIVPLSFDNSPVSFACNSTCFKQQDVLVQWQFFTTYTVKIQASFAVILGSNLIYENLFPGGAIFGGPINGLAFRNLGASVNAINSNSRTAEFVGRTGNGYLGFTTTDNLNGWLKVNFAGGIPGTRTVTFIEGAIESTAGTAITVGDTGLAPVPVPPMLPAMGLAVLALGAAGVRRSRKAA